VPRRDTLASVWQVGTLVALVAESVHKVWEWVSDNKVTEGDLEQRKKEQRGGPGCPGWHELGKC
jgi:hypothetical protein